MSALSVTLTAETPADLRRLLSETLALWSAGVSEERNVQQLDEPSLVEQRVSLIHTYAGLNSWRLLWTLASWSRDSEPGMLELANEMGIVLRAVRAWKRNLHRSAARADRELGIDSAAHRLIPDRWDEAENRRRYLPLADDLRAAILARGA